MVLELPVNKREKINSLCRSIRSKDLITVQELAELVGTLVSASPAVPYGLLYTRHLERDKTRALHVSRGRYGHRFRLSHEAIKDLLWWESRVSVVVNPIRSDHYEFQIETDASLTGWGGSFRGRRANGFWTLQQQKFHINILELLAIENVLRCFQSDFWNAQILIRCDNTVAIAYINNRGGCRSAVLQQIAQRIFQWAEQREIWLVATYIPSIENVIADEESR
ncbi:unnamed protein product, partial [Allacma fusca]